MKRIAALLLAVLCFSFALVGCGRYTSHYKAVLHVHSNSADSASISFHKFEGSEVFKLKCKGDKTAKLQYSGKLEEGSLTVYYDCGGTKTELFSVKSGDEINAKSDALPAGTVYVILETNAKCTDGAFGFEINYD